ncbi:MAG: VWA domain-containing protein, partial [Muribaculaceae bacterium]|nr:VWA domain-containing protein [Muribaculaceae bacterium]
MRRLPIYFLVDISESMVGAPIEEVQQGMRTIVQNLRVDPYALETVFVSIIAFAGKATILSPLTELYKFYPPQFPIGGGTSLGKGLEALMDDIDKSVQKTTKDLKGDWKPIIFLFTDGNPTDNYSSAFKRWNSKYRGHCNLVAISIGDNVNVLTLAQLTDDILLLKETDAESFSQFFKWITASIKSTSMSVGETNIDEVKLAPTTGINLEKVEVNLPTDYD